MMIVHKFYLCTIIINENVYTVKLEACEALDTCDHKHEGASVGIARKEITKRKIIITLIVCVVR